MHRVLFICHGNICRSPMAEFILKHITAQKALPLTFLLLQLQLAAKKLAIQSITEHVISWLSMVSALLENMPVKLPVRTTLITITLLPWTVIIFATSNVLSQTILKVKCLCSWTTPIVRDKALLTLGTQVTLTLLMMTSWKVWKAF